MNTVKRTISLCAVMISLQVYAQEPFLRHYTAKDGLSGNTVYSVREDSHGFIWFCTSQGVSKFDGHDFTTYTTKDGLPDNEIFDLKEDQKGRIWFSGYNARVCYFLNGKIYNASNDPYCRRIQNDVVLNRIIRDAGHTLPSVLLKNVSRPDLRLFAYAYYAVNESQYVTTVNGMSYFVIHGRLVAADNRKVIEVKLDNDEMFIHGGTARGGYLYLSAGAHGSCGIYKLRIDSSGCIKIVAKKLIPYLVYSSHEVLDDSTLLLTSDQGVLFYVHTRNYIDTGKTLLKGIPTNSICKDARGNFWITTLNDGVFLLPESRPGILKKDLGVPGANIEAIYACSSGRVVVGYSNGIMKTNCKGSVTSISMPELSQHNRVLKIANMDNGSLLVGSDNGLLILDTLTWQIKKTTGTLLNQSPIKELVKIKDGFLTGSTHGAGVLNSNGDFVKVLWGGRTTAIESDSNVYWLGTLNGVYTCTNGEVKKFVEDTLLSQSRITAIKKNCNNDLVFCTHQNGVFVWNRQALQHIDELAGLSSNICKKVLADKYCDIWIATSNGLDVLAKNDVNGQYFIKHMPLPDGIATNEIQDFFIQNDTLYMACPEGVMILGVEKQFKKWPVKSYITSVTSRGIDLTGQSYFALPYNKNEINISYTGIAPGDGNNLVYKYVLEGKRDDTALTRHSFVNIDGIGSGEYRFMVWAKSNNSDWSATPSVLSFIIEPPFWETYWFWAIVILITGTTVYLLVRGRIAHIRKTERRKTALNKRMAELEMQALRAQINPHFIFNALNSIQNYYSNNDERRANRYMTTFAKLIRQTLVHSRENWILLASECDMIRDYIELEKMRFKNTFQYKIEMSDTILPSLIKIPSMIIQPYVENAINHGLRHLQNKDGYLLVCFSMFDETSLRCVVDDNGVGFKTAAVVEHKNKNNTHTSLGMDITTSRIEVMNQLYNANICVHIIDKSELDSKERGTTVEIIIPLTHQNYYYEQEFENNNS